MAYFDLGQVMALGRLHSRPRPDHYLVEAEVSPHFGKVYFLH